MTITNQNAAVYRGNSETLAVTLTDVNGAPFAFAGAGTIKYRIAKTADEAEDEALVRKELNAGILLIDGVAEIELLAADTDLDPGQYYHELKVYDGTEVATAMVGTLRIRRALSPMTQGMQSAAAIGADIDVIAEATVVGP